MCFVQSNKNSQTSKLHWKISFMWLVPRDQQDHGFRNSPAPSNPESNPGDCGKAKFSERMKWQDSNTPTTTPYKAFSGALLLWGGNVRGAAGSDKNKHLEYTAYFWKGNINNIADFSWVITLSPPDLCFYPTGGLFKPCFISNPWCIQV